MRKLRLKSWIKELLVVVLCYIAIVGAVIVYQNRIEKINNGSFILVSDGE